MKTFFLLAFIVVIFDIAKGTDNTTVPSLLSSTGVAPPKPTSSTPLSPNFPTDLAGNNEINARAIDATTLRDQILKAQGLLDRMNTDLTTQKEWAKSVHEVIQNYQFKYSKTLNDIRVKAKRVEKLQALLDELKQAQQHDNVKKNLADAKATLDLLVGSGKADYNGVQDSLQAIAAQISKLDSSVVGAASANANHKINTIVTSDIPPDSNDALAKLFGGDSSKPATPAPAVATAAPAVTTSQSSASTPAATTTPAVATSAPATTPAPSAAATPAVSATPAASTTPAASATPATATPATAETGTASAATPPKFKKQRRRKN